MAKARPLGVAIAGLGFGEKVHLPALRACPEAVPVALWHPRQERVEQASRAAELPGYERTNTCSSDCLRSRRMCVTLCRPMRYHP